jgi:hypothetical protein
VQRQHERPAKDTCPHPQILPWLHIDLQRVKLRSIAPNDGFFRTDVPGMSKIRLALVPKRTVQPSLCVTIITCDSHHDNVSLETKRKEIWQKKIRPRGMYGLQML